VESEVIRIARGVIKEWYGEDPQKSESFPRIVNEKHCLRLKNLIDTTRGKILIGGKVDVEDRYVEPTLVVDVMGDDPLLQEEIFGPILPIVTVNGVNDAIEFINARPRPLALYSFSKNSAVNKEMKDKTISGGVCLNDTMWHCVWNGLPFGGVGDSGMGNYHGKYTFDTFSHHRSILDRGFSGISEKLGEARYPPYNDTKISMFTFIIRHFMKFNVRAMPFITHLIAAFVGAAILACFVYSK
jgi:acyl-CoA reductase-like NAD-dependent aldehyde dehydrogenase